MQGFDVQVVNRIAELGSKADGAPVSYQWTKIPGDQSRRQFLVRPTGEPVPYEAEPSFQDVDLLTIEGFAKFVLDARVRRDLPGPVAFYNHEHLFAWLDSDRREDRVHCDLRKTAAHKALEALVVEPGEKPRLFDQPELLRFLRVDMDGTRTSDLLLNWVKTCKWRSSTETQRVVSHGNDAMGTDVQMAVLNPDAEGRGCPEEVVFRIRLWDEPSITDEHDIRCAVVLHLAQKKFEVTPFPGQLERAVETELAAIGEYLADPTVFGNRVPFYRGFRE